MVFNKTLIFALMVVCFCQNLDNLERDRLHRTLKVHADPEESCGPFWVGAQMPRVSASQTFTGGAFQPQWGLLYNDA